MTCYTVPLHLSDCTVGGECRCLNVFVLPVPARTYPNLSQILESHFSQSKLARLLLIVAAIKSAVRADVGRVKTSRVKTESGDIVGLINNGIRSWLGVPYAANPTGDLRWRPPQPATPWTGVMTADTRPLCPQNNLFIDSTKPVGSEDYCLELDIHVAEGVTNAKSVFVFIHGGRHDFGHTWEYPASLARLSAALDPSDGVVTVNIAYRLGGLGYMAMPELTKESDHGTSGNYGMLDQIAALKWIQKNIHNFGTVKNPRVVIHGESAGGYSVSALLASPLAKGLFDGAGIHPE